MMMMSTTTEQQQQQQSATVAAIGAMPAARPPSVLTGYWHRQSIVIGIALLIIGALSVVLNIVGLVVTANVFNETQYQGPGSLAVVGHGIWGGVLVRSGQ